MQQLKHQMLLELGDLAKKQSGTKNIYHELLKAGQLTKADDAIFHVLTQIQLGAWESGEVVYLSQLVNALNAMNLGVVFDAELVASFCQNFKPAMVKVCPELADFGVVDDGEGSAPTNITLADLVKLADDTKIAPKLWTTSRYYYNISAKDEFKWRMALAEQLAAPTPSWAALKARLVQISPWLGQLAPKTQKAIMTTLVQTSHAKNPWQIELTTPVALATNLVSQPEEALALAGEAVVKNFTK